MDTIMWFVNLAWRILLLYIGWIVFRFIMKNGRGTIKEILETIGIVIKTAALKLRMKVAECARKKEPEEEPDRETETDIAMRTILSEDMYNAWKSMPKPKN